MTEHLGIIEILGIAGSVSLLSGWRLYLTVLATGLAMKFNMLPLPEHLASLQVLANPWVMGAAGSAAVLEFFADKVAWLDTIWDTIHTFIRPVGGAMLALAVVDPSDPVTQVIAFLLGGGASLLAHGGKAGARAVQHRVVRADRVKGLRPSRPTTTWWMPISRKSRSDAPDSRATGCRWISPRWG